MPKSPVHVCWVYRLLLDTLLVCTMSPSSPLWSFFDKMEGFYGNNKSHHIAKCHGCIAAHIKILEQKDTEDLALGAISHRRLGSELHLAGKYYVSLVKLAFDFGQSKQVTRRQVSKDP